MNAFSRGVSHALSGFGLIMRPRLRRFVLVPVAVNVLLFVVGGILLLGWAEQLSAALSEWLPDWLQWLRYIIWPLFLLMFLGLVFFGFSALANLIGAPFNGLLAERCATLLGGEPAAMGRSVWAEVTVAVGGEINKLGFYLLRALPLAVLALIPGVGLVASLGLLLLTIWMVALGYLDYPLGNVGMTFKQQRALAGQHRLLMFGFGACVFALTLVPLVNFVVMPAAVCGATRLWLSEHDEFVTRCIDPAI